MLFALLREDHHRTGNERRANTSKRSSKPSFARCREQNVSLHRFCSAGFLWRAKVQGRVQSGLCTIFARATKTGVQTRYFAHAFAHERASLGKYVKLNRRLAIKAS
jgi:hypothetical protein